MTSAIEPIFRPIAFSARTADSRPGPKDTGAFDIEARRFNGVRDAGGLVLSASNAKELNEALDWLIRGKILLEK